MPWSYVNNEYPEVTEFDHMRLAATSTVDYKILVLKISSNIDCVCLYT